jgi:putative ABC transport system substrate-binding protein
VDLGNASSVLAEHETEPAAKTLGISLQVVNVHGPKELESAFRSMLEPRVDALVIQVSAMFFGERSRLAELAAKERIPTIVSERAYAEAGCLITYGAGFADTFSRAAEYVDKILKGAKPADLPIEQPTKFELMINLKTAKALGLTVPPALLARADEVIE